MKNIGFIPAKGNSRRLSRKNIQKIGGKTLVVRAIEGALEAGCFDRVYVSSNDEQILEISVNAGADVLRRHQDLCDDDVRAKDVLRFHLNELNEKYDCVTMLMPTNPLRTAQHIREACELFEDKKSLTLVSVTDYQFNPCMAMTINEGKLVPLYTKEFKWEREEIFPGYYHLNGAIFISRYDFFMENATFIEKSTVPYMMDRFSSVDVDTPEDLMLAEYYYGVMNDRDN